MKVYFASAPQFLGGYQNEIGLALRDKINQKIKQDNLCYNKAAVEELLSDYEGIEFFGLKMDERYFDEESDEVAAGWVDPVLTIPHSHCPLMPLDDGNYEGPF